VRLEGEMFEIMTVRQLPPIESFNKRVSLEFRYGMYLDPSANALMQFPKKCYWFSRLDGITWNN
jgi:hypothetical protein